MLSAPKRCSAAPTRCTKILHPPLQKIKENENHIKCPHCYQVFSRNHSLNRHIQGRRCNKQILENQQEMIKKLEQQIHHLSITNNTVNNIVNTTVNNTVIHISNAKLVELGNENIIDLLSDNEKKQILGKMHKSLIHLVEKVHFSGQYPQFANIVITNLKNNLAYKYSEKEQKFIVDIAEKVISDVIDVHLENICCMYDEQKEDLDKKINVRTGEFIDQITNDPNKYKQTANDIKLLMFNKRNMVDITSQKVMKLQNDTI